MPTINMPSQDDRAASYGAEPEPVHERTNAEPDEPLLSLSLSMHEPMLSLSMLVLDPNHPD